MCYKTIDYLPCVGVPVKIKTNWATYSAIRVPSKSDGYEFKTLSTNHIVQESTVRCWWFD